MHFDQVFPSRTKLDKQHYRRKSGIKFKLPRFQTHPETEYACKYIQSLFNI